MKEKYFSQSLTKMLFKCPVLFHAHTLFLFLYFTNTTLHPPALVNMFINHTLLPIGGNLVYPVMEVN